MVELLIEYSDGNPGALAFLTGVLDQRDPKMITDIFEYIEEHKHLRGTNLYVLWADLCNRDFKAVYHLMTNCPADVLEEAYTKQDYSGCKLVAPYMPENEGEG